MTNIQKDIEAILGECVGEDKELWKPIPHPEGKESILDTETVNIALENIKNMRDNTWEIAYNHALKDIRNRIPETARRVLGMVIDEIGKFDITWGMFGPVENPLMRLEDMKRFLIASLAGEEHKHRFGNILLMSNPPQSKCLDCGEIVTVGTYAGEDEGDNGKTS